MIPIMINDMLSLIMDEEQPRLVIWRANVLADIRICMRSIGHVTLV